MDIGDKCEICEDMGVKNCDKCPFGNPCLGCDEYDEENNTCKGGGC